MSDSKKKRSRQLRPKRHPGYSLIVTGETAKHRAYLLRYLTECREGICLDLGGEDLMTMAQIILVDRVISKLGIIRCLEEHSKEQGVFRDQSLVSSLKESYLAYSNSTRLDLLALGLDRKSSDRVLAPWELADKIDRENAEKKSRKRTRSKSKSH